jgi:hypothetical protein
MAKYPQNVASGAMMYIHNLLKVKSPTTEYSLHSSGGPHGIATINPARLLTLAVTAFYLASKNLDLPLSIKTSAF